MACAVAAAGLCVATTALAYQQGCRRQQQASASANAQAGATVTVAASLSAAVATFLSGPLSEHQADGLAPLAPKGKGELPVLLPVASSDRADADLVKGELRLYDIPLLTYVVSHDMAHLADCLADHHASESPPGPFVASADLFVSRDEREGPPAKGTENQTARETARDMARDTERGQISQARWNVPAEPVPTATSRAQDVVRTCFRQSLHLRDCVWGFPGLAVTGKACLQMAIAVGPGGGLSLSGYTWDTSATCLGTH